MGEVMDGGGGGRLVSTEEAGGGGGGGGILGSRSAGGGGGSWLLSVGLETDCKVGTDGGGTAMPRLDTAKSAVLCMLSVVSALFLGCCCCCSVTTKQCPVESKMEYDIGTLE